MNEFEPLLAEQIADAYCIECESNKVISKFKEAANDENLERILEAQLVTSKASIAYLEKMSQSIDISSSSSQCMTVKAVVKRAEQYLDEGPVNDPGILSHVERINNYKSAIYNGAIRFAKALNNPRLHIELQNLANQTYNIIDRLGRLNNNISDEQAIRNL